jgi:hypothetical protein
MDWRTLHDTKTKGELAKKVIELQNRLKAERELRIRREKNIRFFWDVSDHDFEVIAEREGTFDNPK